MSSIEIRKTLLDKSQQITKLENGQIDVLKARDGFSVTCNSQGEVNISFGNHSARVNLEERTIKIKDSGLEILDRK